jgi:hypothetical protein
MRARMSLLLAASVVTFGCSPASHTTGTDIGAAGGSLSVDGLTLSVPANALAQTTRIQISSGGATPGGYMASSPLYRITPDGLALAQPATVTVALTHPLGDDRLFWSTSDGGWTALATTHSGGGVSGAIARLGSGFAGVAAAGTPDDLAVGTPADMAMPAPGDDLAAAAPDLASAADLLPPAPSCSDGLKDQDETDVDCGGTICFPCKNGKACLVPADCASFTCTNNVCVAPSAPVCTDGTQDGSETDVDCGGPDCSPCAVGKRCQVNSDCSSGDCIGSPLTCAQVPSCSDGLKDRDEGDVDCGGTYCPACAVDKSCYMDRDCTTGYCATAGFPTSIGTCLVNTCAPMFVTAGTLPQTANAVADFNGDGKLDLVVSNSFSFSVMLGNGDGTFQDPSNASAFSGGSLSVADFDGNGVPDLLLGTSTSFQALIGAGDGTFRRAPAVTPTPTTNLAMFAGDFDGDGRSDVVRGYNGSLIGFELYPGLGDGTFGPVTTTSISNNATQGLTAMALQRGKPHDYWSYVTHGVGGHSLFAMDGTRSAFKLQLGPNLIVSGGDLDGDGIADVVVDLPNTGGVPEGAIAFGAFVSMPGNVKPLSQSAFADGTPVLLGDFNGDGKTDLVVSGSRLMCGNGDGTFMAPVAFASGGGTLQGDFDGDGRNDFIAGGTIYLNRN